MMKTGDLICLSAYRFSRIGRSYSLFGLLNALFLPYQYLFFYVFIHLWRAC